MNEGTQDAVVEVQGMTIVELVHLYQCEDSMASMLAAYLINLDAIRAPRS